MLKKVKLSKKGFTLVELLAVIVIMGILMMVAIPSVSRVIENSRKDTFVDISKAYTDSVRTAWSADNLQCGSGNTSASGVDDGNYYVLIDSANDTSALLDQGGKSSWGNREVKGYVRINVTTDAEGRRNTKYYVALTDGTHGIYDDLSNQKESDKLVRGDILMNLSDSSQQSQLESISTKPFINGEVTTCSSEGGNWTVRGISFENDSWLRISGAVKAGNHSYEVGDTKEVDLGALGKHTVRIANTSTPSECSQADFSQTACGFVIEFADIISKHNMNPSGEYKGTNYPNGWNVDGWPATNIRSYLNSEVYNALPSELRNAIINTSVVSGHGKTAGEVNFTSTDKLYLLSTSEVWAQGDVYDTARNNTRQLDYYANLGVTTSNYSGAIKQHNGSNYFWWLRSAIYIYTNNFYSVSSNGDMYYYYIAPYSGGVAPAFRIA